MLSYFECNYYALFVCLILTMMTSCGKIIEVTAPRSELTNSTVFDNQETATAALLNLYVQLQNSGFASGTTSGLHFIGGLSADELTFIGASNNMVAIDIATNKILPNNNTVNSFWSHAYRVVYLANALLEGVGTSNNLNESLKKRISGEALFVRAFCHFYLVNAFGQIPYVRTTDYRVNSQIGKLQVDDIYQLIEKDLIDSEALLTTDYNDFAGERIFPVRYAATALLARLYLYMENYRDAEQAATAVIENTLLYRLDTLPEVFRSNSNESIFQLRPLQPNQPTREGTSFIVSATSSRFSALSNDLVDCFERGDLRKNVWVGVFFNADGTSIQYCHKYKKGHDDLSSPNEYSMVLRLAEQYLIRAEARVHQQNRSGAINDVDMIRQRAGLPLLGAIKPGLALAELLEVIIKERRVELMCEWGHRWFDLKRTGLAKEVLMPLKPSLNEEGLLFPIPESELVANPNLLPQNPGY